MHTLRRILGPFAAIAAVAALAACTLTDAEPLAITTATWHQQKAVPDFDDAEHTQTDAARLDRLADILAEHGIRGGVVETPESECPPGATTTWIDYRAGDGSAGAQEIVGSLRTCGDSDLATQIDDLVAGW